MLAAKKDTKKNLVYGVVLVVIFGIIGYMLVDNLNLLPKGGSSSESAALNLGNTASRKAIKEVKAKAADLEMIDISIFEDKRFKSLKEKTNVEIDISGIKSGKNNPFLPGRD